MVNSGRRDPRYRCTLSMELKGGRVQGTVETEDVSFSGAFVVTPLELAVRQLVQIEARLDEGPFEAHAMVVFVRREGGGRTAGFGLKFFGLSRDMLERWARFVRATREREQAAPPPHMPRRSSHTTVVIKVRPQGLADLIEVYTRDIAEGGMFVETDQPLLVGSSLMAEIVHPDTGEHFELECVVRRVVRDPSPGVGVEFVGLEDELRAALHDFVSSVAPPIVIDGLDEY